MKQVFTSLFFILVLAVTASAQGQVFIDYNCNAIFDGNDQVLAHAVIVDQSGAPLAMSNEAGEYSVHLPPNTTYTLSVETPAGLTSEYLTVSSGDEELVYTEGSFPLCAANPEPNLSVTISEASVAVPGQVFTYDICVNYTGAEPAEVNLQFDSGSPGGVIITDSDGAAEINGELWWIISGMMPFTDTCFQVSSAIFSSLPPGTSLHPNADVTFVNPGIVESDISDNSFELPHQVQALAETNQKWVNKELINYLEITIAETAMLDYTIRFANTGNDTVFQTTITDVVEPLLQPASFQMIQSDHDYNFSRTDSLLVWEIQTALPPCSVDPNACKGYVHFQLTSIENPLNTDSIRNSATIQFDSGTLISTDTVLTAFSQCSEFLDITGPDSACVGSTLNFATSVAGFPTYLWLLDGSLVSSSTTYTWQNAPQGAHTVGLVVSDGFCVLTQTIDVQIDEPAFVSIIASHDSICNSEPLFANHNGVLTWEFNGSSFTGSDTLHAGEDGIYTASVVNACSNSSANIQVQIDSGPVSMSIFQNGNVLTASEEALIYQWYLNDVPLTDSTSSSIVANESGSYSVEAFITSGCTITSDVFLFETGIEHSDHLQIKLFPQPGDQNITLVCGSLSGNISFEIFDLCGRKIRDGQLNGQLSLNTEDLPNGQYILLLSNGPIRMKKSISVLHP